MPEKEPKSQLPGDQVEKMLREILDLGADIYPFPTEEPESSTHPAKGNASPEAEEKRNRISELQQTLIEHGNFKNTKEISGAMEELEDRSIRG